MIINSHVHLPPLPDITAMTTTSMLSIISARWQLLQSTDVVEKVVLLQFLLLLLVVITVEQVGNSRVQSVDVTCSSIDNDCDSECEFNFRIGFVCRCLCRVVVAVVVVVDVARCFKFVGCCRC